MANEADGRVTEANGVINGAVVMLAGKKTWWKIKNLNIKGAIQKQPKFGAIFIIFLITLGT